MSNRNADPAGGAPRRNLFARFAGATALGLTAWLPARAGAQPHPDHDDTDWPGKLPGRHRMLIDGYDVSGGAPLDFGHNFLASFASPSAANVVIVLRAGALPIALNSEIWAKYKIGESFQIDDPETHAPAVKNPFLHAKPGVLRADAMAVDRLLTAGAIFGACNVALQGQSGRLAHNAGVTAEAAAKEWAANVIPGITVISSGVWGVNRAQEVGCTYCAGS